MKHSMKNICHCLKGFILKDYLLSLVIMLILLPIVISSLKVISHYKIYDERIQDEIAITQLRDKMLIGVDFSVSPKTIEYRIGEETWQLIYQNERVYLAPGYQLFLDDVESCLFKQTGNTLFIEYQKDGVTYVFALAKV